MNRINHFSFICLSVLAIACSTERLEQAVTTETNEALVEQYLDGVVNIYFSEETAEMLPETDCTLMTRSAELNFAFKELGVTSVQRLFPHAGEFEPRTRKAGLHRWYKVIYDPIFAVTKAQESFAGIPGVEVIEAERRIAIDAFNDPKFSSQWHYYNDGSISADFIQGADINVNAVWENYTTGNSSVIVAVVDSGVDYEHEDLAANYVQGMNFGTGGKVTPNDHGTHVAGTIAAVNNNGIGVCGIAGGDASAGIPGVGILSCQIFSGNNPVGGATALKWAADNGAVIANNSWGYVFENEDAANDATIEGTSLQQAIDYFIKNAGCDNEGNQLPGSPMKGGVVLFSAGNDGWKYNPIGEYEPVVAVGSIGPDYNRAYYSCYGDWVDIAAPGGNSRITKGMIYSTVVGNNYEFMQGTSMSCPHATGVAALIASYFGGPGFTNEMLVERLIGGARKDVIPASAKIGPLVDALGSFTIGSTIAPEKVEDFGFDCIGNKVTLKVKVTPDQDNVKAFEYIVHMSQEQALLENIDMKAIPESVKEFHFKVDSTPVGEVMQMIIPDLEFNTEYFFTVTGCDYSLNYSESSPIKAVRTGGNNAPVITPAQGMEEFILKAYETLTLKFYISDPEGDQVNAKLLENMTGVTMQKNADSWIVTISGNLLKPGNYECTISAADKYGITSEFSFKYEVLDNSAPISLRSFDDYFTENKSETFTFDLSEYFYDPDFEQLSYTITDSNKNVSKNEVSENTLSITTTGYGLNTITIKATDAKKASISLECRIMVKDSQNLIEMYPVPVTDILNIRTGREKDTEITIRTISGDVIYSEKSQVSAFDPAVVDMNGCAPGKYMVSVVMDGQTTERVITKI